MKSLTAALSVGAALLLCANAPIASADPSAPSPGKFCTKDQEGKTAAASDGTTLVCSKGSDNRDRWTASAGAAGAGLGKFCTKDQEGKTASASDGTTLVCAKGSDNRDRWTKK